MMEREFITQKIKEYQIQEFVDKTLGNVGHSHTVMKKTPLGEKVIVFASRPGLVVGRRGANIKDLTKALKKRFKLENPQIEISEVENVFLDANIVAEKIVSSLERFGTARFKGVGHKTMERVMDAGARGVEIVISGKVPGARARSWRFYQGYVKKCGDAALENVRKSIQCAHLKPGSVGVRVSIMPPNVRLPDDISLKGGKESVEKGAVEKKEVSKKVDKEENAQVVDEKGDAKAPQESPTGGENSDES
jgi:small subunit ribosomal protein S3